MTSSPESRAWLRLMVGLAVCLPCTGGCNSSAPIVVINKNSDPTRDRLIHLGYAYREAVTRTGRLPKNIDDIRPIMSETSVTNESLVSPRDGQPFEVVWGTACIVMPEPNQNPSLLIHESVGKNGTRYVLWNFGTTEILSDEEFAKAKGASKP
jgi:hypothetical protein